MYALVKSQVMNAYADCHMPFEKAQHLRNLRFESSDVVTRSEAYEIMSKFVKAYNDFSAEAILKFPRNTKFLIARELSVCLYVLGENLPSPGSVSASVKERCGKWMKYWWD